MSDSRFELREGMSWLQVAVSASDSHSLFPPQFVLRAPCTCPSTPQKPKRSRPRNKAPYYTRRYSPVVCQKKKKPNRCPAAVPSFDCCLLISSQCGRRVARINYPIRAWCASKCECCKESHVRHRTLPAVGRETGWEDTHTRRIEGPHPLLLFLGWPPDADGMGAMRRSVDFYDIGEMRHVPDCFIVGGGEVR
jgi:hypothetical protein